jgi:cytoskeletal protein CcmA (bactofilin family)
MTDIKLKILKEEDFLFLAKRQPEGVYDRETLKNLDRIIKRLNRGKPFCTGDEKRLLKKYQNVTFGVLLPKKTDTKGKINHPGPVHVLGNFSGDLVAESILIDKAATVLANITAKEVLCKGKVRGDIRATNKLRITKEAEVRGDIHSPSMNIEKGAIFEGRCSIPKIRTPHPIFLKITHTKKQVKNRLLHIVRELG